MEIESSHCTKRAWQINFKDSGVPRATPVGKNSFFHTLTQIRVNGIGSMHASTKKTFTNLKGRNEKSDRISIDITIDSTVQISCLIQKGVSL